VASNPGRAPERILVAFACGEDPESITMRETLGRGPQQRPNPRGEQRGQGVVPNVGLPPPSPMRELTPLFLAKKKRLPARAKIVGDTLALWGKKNYWFRKSEKGEKGSRSRLSKRGV